MADPYENNTANKDTFYDRNKDWINPIISVGAGYIANREIQKQNQEFNASEAEKNRNFEEKMSNTAYQRGYADMLAAGLNPNLAGGSGGASTPSGTSAASANAPYMDAGVLANAALTSAQIDNMEADSQLKLKEAGVSKSKRDAIEWQNNFNKITEKLQIQMMTTDITKKEYDIMVNEATDQLLQEEIGTKAAERKSAERNRRWHEIRDSIVAFIPFANGMKPRSSGGITINNGVK